MEKFNIKQVLYYRGQNVVDSGLEKSKCTWVFWAMTSSLVNHLEKANFHWNLLLQNIMY